MEYFSRPRCRNVWRAGDQYGPRLPVYTVIVALYDEAVAVGGPRHGAAQPRLSAEKLDIKLVLEPDDTRRVPALMRCAGSPIRSHHRARRGAAHEAEGAQCRALAGARHIHGGLRRGGSSGAGPASPRARCVPCQRTRDGLRAGAPHHRQHRRRLVGPVVHGRYAGLFDVLLPGLAQRQLPLPLGGSSNHFDTDALRRVGGWDAYNVTEDADLGMRLARLGYETAVIDSTTYEECRRASHRGCGSARAGSRAGCASLAGTEYQMNSIVYCDDHHELSTQRNAIATY